MGFRTGISWHHIIWRNMTRHDMTQNDMNCLTSHSMTFDTLTFFGPTIESTVASCERSSSRSFQPVGTKQTYSSNRLANQQWHRFPAAFTRSYCWANRLAQLLGQPVGPTVASCERSSNRLLQPVRRIKSFESNCYMNPFEGNSVES